MIPSFAKARCVVAVLSCALCGVLRANTPPVSPAITEPPFDGRIVNSQDVHMETGPFSDPDPGDTHFCSDWEIWRVSPSELVWSASCVTGVLKVHIHLGDGVFQGSHAGRTSLLPSTNYTLRARHRDSSNDPPTEWSPYSVRQFSTAPLSTVFPLEVDDIASLPVPVLTTAVGGGVVLPAGAAPGSVTLEGPAGELLVREQGLDGVSNQVLNPAALPAHANVRARVAAGSAPLFFSDTDFAITDDHGVDHTVYLPAVNLAPGQTALYWVSSNGATYNAQSGQTTPDFSSLARSAPVPWQISDPGYKVEVVATGFQFPVNIAFIPHPAAGATAPLFYVSELYGTIKYVARNGTVGVYASNLLNYDPGGVFPGSGEQGLTGLTVDPVTGDVFAGLMYDAGPPNNDHFPKVVRFHSTDGGRTAATQAVILDMAGETQGPSHQISNLSIAFGGKLFVHMGDGFTTATAQNLDSFRGKILRLNLDGTAPPDNPFYDANNGITARDYVYAYGFRNPFGGAWRFADGQHYSVENGPTVDRFAQVVKGRNYLWGGSDADMANFALYNWNPSSAPVNLAFIQSSSFGGSQFPQNKQGHAFVTESSATWSAGPGKQISEFVLDAAGALTAPPTNFALYNGTGHASACGLAAGPDGLYFTDLYKDDGASALEPGANVLRIRWVGIPDFKVSAQHVLPRVTVQFTDTSNVPAPTAWQWSFGDGATSTQRNPTHSYAAEGDYDVRLSVAGSGGLVSVQRPAYVSVEQTPTIAVISGAAPASSSDHNLADHLRILGFHVHEYDDEPANRPGAPVLAEDSHAAIVLPSVVSANIAGEFRTEAVPLLIAKPGLMAPASESLATSGTQVAASSAITITSTAHEITSGFALGDVAVFQAGVSMGVARGPFPAGSTVLATRSGTPTDATLIAAEEGAPLLSGYISPARRVFLFLGTDSFDSATNAGVSLIDRALCWAIHGTPTVVTQPQPATVASGGAAALSMIVSGAGPLQYQWRRAGVALVDDGRITGATTPILTINPVAVTDAGPFDCLVTCPCGSATTASAMLTVTGCYANCDGSTTPPILNVADFTCFIQKFAAGDPYANCDHSSGQPTLNILDFVCFQQKMAAGCP